MLSREDVVAAYRLILGREPESEAIVEHHRRTAPSLAMLRAAFLASPEFRDAMPGVPAPLPAILPADVPAQEVQWQCEPHVLADLLAHIERVWQKFGTEEAYWSVFADPRFRPETVEANREAFFATGRWHHGVFDAALARCGLASRRRGAILEYGCGVGRLTVSLARTWERVHALDISGAHLDLCRRNAALMGARNVDFIKLAALDGLERLPRVDAFLSVIVLQHNPPPVIARILERLFAALGPGGIAYFQVPTYSQGYRFRVEEYLQGLYHESLMEMHVLPQPAVFALAARAGMDVLEVVEDDYTGARHMHRSNTFLMVKR